MLYRCDAAITVSNGAIVQTSFNNEEKLRSGEFVVECVCGCSFVAQAGTQSCVACNSIRLKTLIYCV